MLKYLSFLTCLSIAIITLEANVYAAKKWDCDRSAPGENIYKHYSGTIGKRKVSLDLKYGFCGASNYGGSYFYYTDTKETKYIIIGEPDNTAHNATLFAQEYAIDENWFRMHKEQTSPVWKFVINEKSITGQWFSGDGKQVEPIALEESTNAVLFDFVWYEESMKNVASGNPNAKCESIYRGVIAKSANDNDVKEFINTEFCKMPAPTFSGTTGLKNVPGYLAKNNFEKYMDISLRPANTGKTPDNSTFMTFLLPIYRSNGIMVIDYYIYERTFTYHNAHTYKCIDYNLKKVWKLSDIIKSNDSELAGLLYKEYDKQIKPVELRNAIPASKIIPTENFMLLPGGLAFIYPVAENSEMLNQLTLFIPYSKLKAFLSEEFLSRMKL